jgi:uncharacterized DUF497 family protein
MRFEWDEAKNRKNFKKHGIEFETAVLVFDDPYAVSDRDRIVDGEAVADDWSYRSLCGVSGASLVG